MPLSEFDLNLITFLDQQYHLTGELLTAEKADKDFGIPVVKFTNAMASKEFRAALAERGITFERLEDDWTSKSLTPEQLAVANSLLDLTDSRSQKKKLQDLGISTGRLQMWLRDPVFKDYLHKRAEQLIGDNAHEAHLALLDKIRMGDLPAIKYFNEMTGRYVQVQNRPQANGNVDVQQLLIKVIEIIDLHVKDVDTKIAIGNEFKKLIAARNMASALSGMEEPITVPETAIGQTLEPKPLL